MDERMKVFRDEDDRYTPDGMAIDEELCNALRHILDKYPTLSCRDFTALGCHAVMDVGVSELLDREYQAQQATKAKQE